MSWLNRLLGKSEKRSTPTSWDLLRTGATFDTSAGVPVNAYAAENLSVVTACVQAICDAIAMLPLHVYRKLDNGGRIEDPAHPVARIFRGDANGRQTAAEWLETTVAHTLLRGNSYSEIKRDGRGAPVALEPLHPDMVSVVRVPRSNAIAFDVSDINGGSTRRLLFDEMFWLKDLSQDGVVGVSRLQRAREAFGNALAVERFSSSVYRNGAALSGVLMHPESLDVPAQDRLRESFKQAYAGSDKAGETLVLEEGMKWQAVSVSPADAEMLASRKFSVESIARVYRVPLPVIGNLEGGNYSSLSEIGRWFHAQTIQPWLNKIERAIERALLSEDGRRTHEVEFDADLLMRTDMLSRYQSYRIAREIGLANAQELRRWERLNPRTDAEADAFLSPMNMQSEQTARPRGDRGGDE
jgi:HK97 family phage portal protein